MLLKNVFASVAIVQHLSSLRRRDKVFENPSSELLSSTLPAGVYLSADIVHEMVETGDGSKAYLVLDRRTASSSFVRLLFGCDLKSKAKELEEICWLDNQAALISDGHSFTAENAKKWRIDDAHLKMDLYKIMTNAVLKTPSATKHVLVVGLGGGAIQLFLEKHGQSLQITTLEEDAALARIATKWFGLKKATHQQVIIADWIKWIKNRQLSQTKFDAIVVDVGAEDPKFGLAAPLKEFVNDDKLIQKITHILTPTGTLVMNVLLSEHRSDKSEKKTLMDKYNALFGHKKCFFVQSQEENQAFICSKEMKIHDTFESQKTILVN